MAVDAETSVARDNSLGLLRLAAFLLRNRRMTAWTAFGCALVGMGVSLVTPRTYVATAAFTPSMPQSRGTVGSLAGLASQLGLQVDLSGGDPVAFYAALAKSRQLLNRVASDTYHTADGSGGVQVGDLWQLFTGRTDTENEGRLKTIAALRKNVSVEFNPQTNIVEIKVEARRADLAEQIAERLLSEVNDFYLRRRQLQAAGERLFIESRIAAAESSLAVEEAALASFLRANRQFQNSPDLVLEHDKLARRVDLRQQVLTSLVQNLERAKIEEVRNTSVVIPIDLPRGSAVPKSRGVVLNLALGFFFGGLVGIGLCWARELVEAEREHSPVDYAVVRAFGANAIGSVRDLVIRKRTSSLRSKDSG